MQTDQQNPRDERAPRLRLASIAAVGVAALIIGGLGTAGLQAFSMGDLCFWCEEEAPAPEPSGDDFEKYDQVTGISTGDNLKCAQSEAASDVEKCKSMFSCDMLANLLNECQDGAIHPSAEEPESVTEDVGSYETDTNADAITTEPAGDSGQSQGEYTGTSDVMQGAAKKASGVDSGSSASWDGGSEYSPNSSADDGWWGAGDDSGQEGETSCLNGIDEDANNAIDDCSPSKIEELTNCANLIDDDGNDQTDYTFDLESCGAGGIGELRNCKNGLDDDGNGLIDATDLKCWEGGPGEITTSMAY